MNLLPVRILGRDPSNFSWEIGIGAGTDDGVRVGMPVVAAAGSAGALAGGVISVGSDSATSAVVDARSSVVARPAGQGLAWSGPAWRAAGDGQVGRPTRSRSGTRSPA
jgi:cell shape-determining protein MreC